MQRNNERHLGYNLLEVSLQKLDQKISDSQAAADNLVTACHVLGFSIDPPTPTGDQATDIARAFLQSLVRFLRSPAIAEDV